MVAENDYRADRKDGMDDDMFGVLMPVGGMSNEIIKSANGYRIDVDDVSERY